MCAFNQLFRSIRLYCRTIVISEMAVSLLALLFLSVAILLLGGPFATLRSQDWCSVIPESGSPSTYALRLIDYEPGYKEGCGASFFVPPYYSVEVAIGLFDSAKYSHAVVEKWLGPLATPVGLGDLGVKVDFGETLRTYMYVWAYGCYAAYVYTVDLEARALADQLAPQIDANLKKMPRCPGVMEPRVVSIWQEIPLYSTAGQFATPAEANLVIFDGHPAKVKNAWPESLIVRVPEQLVGPRVGLTTWPDTTRRTVEVIAKIIRGPGDTVVVHEEEVIFVFPWPLLFDEVTRATPPLVQDVMPGVGPGNRQSYMFLGSKADGVAAVRIANTSTDMVPLSLAIKVIAPNSELFDKSDDPTIGNLFNLGIGNAGVQFPITQTGLYEIIVEADSSSWGPFPCLYQIHLAGNVGLPLDFPRGTRLDTYFNHPAPREETLVTAAPALGEFAETALFKFGNPLSTSRHAIAVLVPPANAGYPFGVPPVRATPPGGIVDPTVPSAPATPFPGAVLDFAQVPIPASPIIGGQPSGVAAILGNNDGNAVTLPMETTASLIVDMGSGNEIVNGTGADFRVMALSGSYEVAVSNTPFASTFIPVGSGSNQSDFDLAGTGLSCARYVRIWVPTGTAVIDAVQSLNFFVEEIHPTVGPISDVGWATITLRRQKSPVTPLDPLLELIGPDGSFLGKNESAFGDDTEQDRSDAALINVPLTQQGFYRYLGRGYDWQADGQSFGSFFTRLETGGNYDPVEISVSSSSENQTGAQKQGTISQPRQRDSYLFQATPGTTVSIVVSGAGASPLPDPLVELYDPEDFFIAANDNDPGRGKNAVMTVALPTIGHGGGALPSPSTYRIVVMGNDKAAAQSVPTEDGIAYPRQANGGTYELKVFTGTTAVESKSTDPSLPNEYALYQNYPNPFNPVTTIEYKVKDRCHVLLKVYDTLGKEVTMVVNAEHQPGFYRVSFNAQNLASGVYFYKIQMQEFQAVRKMVVLE